jgi:hypothetical protein
LLLQRIDFVLFSVSIYIGLNEDKDEAIKHMKYARNSFSVKFPATHPDKPTKDELWDHRDTVKGELGYGGRKERILGAAAGSNEVLQYSVRILFIDIFITIHHYPSLTNYYYCLYLKRNVMTLIHLQSNLTVLLTIS